MHNINLNRRGFLKLAACSVGAAGLGLTGLASADIAGQRPPNILLILTDDQGFGDIRSHGNPVLDTPVMDGLAAAGARLDRFYVSPVCAPTRASLLTGRYHLRTGVHGVTRTYETMRVEEVTLAEVLKRNDYATGCFGKWHNGAHYPHHPNGQGFDEFFGFCAGHWNNYFDTTLDHNGRPAKTEGYIADVVTDASIAFIERNRRRPFLCYVPYNPPHGPFQVPDRYFDKYKDRGLDDRLACIYGMVENLDDNIGRLLAALDRLGLAEDTIVLFITDNGPNGQRYNANMKGTKGSPHEGGVRVPCFIRWPRRIQPGIVVKPITAHIDILPTLAELTGVDTGPTLPLDGTSLAPLLTGQSRSWPDRMLFTHWGNRGAVRTEQYRLVVFGNRSELYDMQADPDQTTDIAADRPTVVKRLHKAYGDWLAEVSEKGFDPIPTEIGHPESPVVVLPGHEAFLEPAKGEGIRYVGNSGWANDWITKWTDEQAYPCWHIKVVRPGRYRVSLLYGCEPENVGAELQLEFADRSLRTRIQKNALPRQIPSPDRVPRGEVYEKAWPEWDAGAIELEPFTGVLKVRALSKPGEEVIELKAVRIERVNG